MPRPVLSLAILAQISLASYRPIVKGDEIKSMTWPKSPPMAFTMTTEPLEHTELSMMSTDLPKQSSKPAEASIEQTNMVPTELPPCINDSKSRSATRTSTAVAATTIATPSPCKICSKMQQCVERCLARPPCEKTQISITLQTPKPDSFPEVTSSANEETTKSSNDQNGFDQEERTRIKNRRAHFEWPPIGHFYPTEDSDAYSERSSENPNYGWQPY